MKRQKDIFDRIMSLKCFSFIYPFYEKHKELLLYLLFGGLAFVVSISSYAFFEKVVRFDPLVANVFSWVMAVAFAYITNRIWVFESESKGIIELLKEAVSFFNGRVATLIVEELILLVGINVLAFNSMVIKVVAQIVVIILNYFISKLLIFNTK